MIELDDKTADNVIQQIKVILLKFEYKRNHEKITKTALYETLVAEGVLKPGSKEAFDSLYEYAVEGKLLSERGIKKFKKKRGTKAYSFTKDQLVQLFDTVESPKVAIACYTTLICGLRINEVCNLRLADIDFVQCTVTVRDSKNSRRKFEGYGKDRIIKFHPEFKGPLEKWKDIIGATSEWFLPSMTHPSKPMRKKSLHEQYRQTLKAAKLLVPEYTVDITQKNHGKLKSYTIHRHRYYFHTLRHSYAQIWRDNGGDRDTLQKQLGHTDPATTQKYYDTTEEQISNDVDKVFGRSDYPVKNSTIRPPVQKEQVDNSAMMIAQLEYEKKKIELEIMKEQSKMMGVKQEEKKTVIEIRGGVENG